MSTENKQTFLDEIGLSYLLNKLKNFFDNKFNSIETTIENNEYTVSSALNDLNYRIDNIKIPEQEQLEAGKNISITDNKINANGYTYTNTSNTVGSISLNNSDRNTSQAKGNYTTVLGWNCSTSDGDSSANSFCGGDSCECNNEDCLVYGKGLKSYKSHQTIFGKYNKPMPDTWLYKSVVEVGDGDSDSSRKTLFSVQEVTGWCGSLGGFAKDTFTDFAEYFEWEDGNPDDEDRIGYMVALEGDKIRIAKNMKECFGIISGTAGFVGDYGYFDWHGRYLYDEFGRHIVDEDGKYIENPEYDPNREYTPRVQRKEWDAVGLMGKVHVRQDGTLIPGGFAGCKNGIATNATTGYKVLKIINENVALVLIK